MNHTFIGVVPLPDYLLKFFLKDGSIRIFNMKPYLTKGDFTVLQDWNIFKTVKLDELQGIEWDYKNLSLSKDTIIANMF